MCRPPGYASVCFNPVASATGLRQMAQTSPEGDTFRATSNEEFVLLVPSPLARVRLATLEAHYLYFAEPLKLCE